jgi:hypothetical protein
VEFPCDGGSFGSAPDPWNENERSVSFGDFVGGSQWCTRRHLAGASGRTQTAAGIERARRWLWTVAAETNEETICQRQRHPGLSGLLGPPELISPPRSWRRGLGQATS